MTNPFYEKEIICVSTDNTLVKRLTSINSYAFVSDLNYTSYATKTPVTTIYHIADLTDVTDFFFDLNGVELFTMLYPSVNLELYRAWLISRGLSVQPYRVKINLNTKRHRAFYPYDILNGKPYLFLELIFSA